MKKLLLIILSCIISNCVCGQEWTKTNVPADELRGNKEYNAFSFETEKAKFVFWDNSEFDMKFIAKEAIFNYQTIMGNTLILVNVGFSDDNDNMIKKDQITLNVESGKGTVAFTSFNWAWSKKKKKPYKDIIDYIKAGSGYVRFLTELYGKSELDFHIKSMK